MLILGNVIVLVISLSVIYVRYSIQSKQTIAMSTEQTESAFKQQPTDVLSTQNMSPTEQAITTLTKLVEQSTATEQVPQVVLRKPKFVYFSSKAKRVELIGDFNDWIPQKMKKVSSNRWELTIEIPEGRYLYNFLVDGKIVLDPNNKRPPELSSQGFKSSVLELK